MALQENRHTRRGRKQLSAFAAAADETVLQEGAGELSRSLALVEGGPVLEEGSARHEVLARFAAFVRSGLA